MSSNRRDHMERAADCREDCLVSGDTYGVVGLDEGVVYGDNVDVVVLDPVRRG